MKRSIFLGLVAISVWMNFSSALADQKASFYVNLGFSYYKLGKYQEAVEQFKLVLERSSDENLRTEATRYLEMLE